jgi:hypothetical protein
MRVATVEDRESVLGLLKCAAIWLNGRGVDYWQNWLDPPAHHVAWIDEGLSAGEFRIVESAGDCVGCLRIKRSDPLFWGVRDDSAGYVHSLTIARDPVYRGLGAVVLDEVASQLAANGASWLRLDCGAGVSGLRSYYESHGFAAVGTTTVDGEENVLYQRSTAA